jgi:hypothetical protein
MEEANKRNEGRRFYTTACEVDSFWFVNTDTLIGNDQLIMVRWKQYSY